MWNRKLGIDTFNNVCNKSTASIWIQMNLYFCKSYNNPTSVFEFIISIDINKLKMGCFSNINIVDTFIRFVNFYIEKDINSILFI